ncbi:MAG: hypothetical protein JXR56_03890, partial [Candidatus Cloacimonetes bacterium]|nr:hypothetical protein [Candidatus Cloacimonadota bacterium]
MKKILIPVILFIFTISLFAQLEEYVPDRQMSGQGKPLWKPSHPVSRTQTFEWEFGFPPVIANNASYYDYMIGTYNSTPFHHQPTEIGNGFYYSYMGRASATTQPRAYYGYMDGNNTVVEDRTFSSINRLEWFPDSVVDKNGKMLISYHSDSDGDGHYEQHYGNDPYFSGIPGIPSNERDVMDNPITFNGFDNNVFTWAQIRVGDSPLGDPYQRVYILARNRNSHSVVNPDTGSPYPCENPYIAFADYTPDDIDFDLVLNWTYTSIPELDAWNADTNEWRRPYYSFLVGSGDLAGKLFYMGYHLGDLAEDEPDFDVFIHDDYGNTDTAWRRVSFDATFPLVNPVNANGDYYFVDTDNGNAPYDLYWGIVNTGHFNISVDSENRLHMPATYCINNTEDSYFYYFHNVKDMIFDPVTETLDIVDVFPRSTTPGALFNPWDLNGDGAVDEYWDDGTYDGIDDGVTSDQEGYGNIKTNTIWPFMHWDKDSHETSMFFQLNLLKITNANEDGIMALMWHDATAAVDFNVSSLTYWQPYAEQSELYIAISGDNG